MRDYFSSCRSPNALAFIGAGSGIIESYEARYDARSAFSERMIIRVDKISDVAIITGSILDRGDFADLAPASTKRRKLSEAEWTMARVWIEAGLWLQPWWEGEGAPVIDGDQWTIAGYDGGAYRVTRRATRHLLNNSGHQVYELGARLACLAGLGGFNPPEQTSLVAIVPQT